MTSLTPEYGVRVLFELETSGPPAVYRMTLFLPESTSCFVASHSAHGFDVSPAGSIEAASNEAELAASSAALAPDWALDVARGFLKTLHKNHAGEQDWPRRQLRWRDRR